MSEWILVIILLNGSGNGIFKYGSSKMTMPECEKAAKTLNAKIPSGGDAEQGVAVVCSKSKLEYLK